MDKKLLQLLSPNQRTITLSQKIAKIGSIFVLCMALISLLTYDFHISVTSAILPHVIGMKPIVSLGFITSASALLLLLVNDINKKTTWETRLALLLSSFTLLLGTTTTVYLLIQHALFTNGNISLDMSLSFIFIGIALLLLPIPAGKHFMRVAQGCSLFVALMSMFAILGYLYRSLSFYTNFPFSPMSLSSAFTFSLLSISLLLAKPERGFTKVLTRSTPSSILALRLILFTLTIPAIIGFSVLQGEELKLFDAQTGITLLVIGNISLLSIAVWVNSSVLQKLEIENLLIKNELERRNVTLEVDEKSQAAKILELEEEKQDAYDKLSNREKIMDLPQNEL